MNVQSDYVRNRWLEGPSYRGAMTEKILHKEGLKQ